jgi:hypothetical protein
MMGLPANWMLCERSATPRAPGRRVDRTTDNRVRLPRPDYY